MLEKILVFTKAQVSSFAGGIVDYSVMIFFTEVFHLHYTLSIVIGGVFGAIVNFLLNKRWTFYSKEHWQRVSGRKQLLRFVLMAVNSIFLKAIGTCFITSLIKTDYKISRIILNLTISMILIYNLQKNWVFKK